MPFMCGMPLCVGLPQRQVGKMWSRQRLLFSLKDLTKRMISKKDTSRGSFKTLVTKQFDLDVYKSVMEIDTRVYSAMKEKLLVLSETESSEARHGISLLYGIYCAEETKKSNPEPYVDFREFVILYGWLSGTDLTKEDIASFVSWLVTEKPEPLETEGEARSLSRMVFVPQGFVGSVISDYTAKFPGIFS